MDRYSPDELGEMQPDPAGEWIHGDDTLSEIKDLLG
jgi:hypothetical protein